MCHIRTPMQNKPKWHKKTPQLCLCISQICSFISQICSYKYALPAPTPQVARIAQRIEKKHEEAQDNRNTNKSFMLMLHIKTASWPKFCIYLISSKTSSCKFSPIPALDKGSLLPQLPTAKKAAAAFEPVSALNLTQNSVTESFHLKLFWDFTSFWDTQQTASLWAVQI